MTSASGAAAASRSGSRATVAASISSVRSRRSSSQPVDDSGRPQGAAQTSFGEEPHEEAAVAHVGRHCDRVEDALQGWAYPFLGGTPRARVGTVRGAGEVEEMSALGVVALQGGRRRVWVAVQRLWPQYSGIRSADGTTKMCGLAGGRRRFTRRDVGARPVRYRGGRSAPCGDRRRSGVGQLARGRQLRLVLAHRVGRARVVVEPRPLGQRRPDGAVSSSSTVWR